MNQHTTDFGHLERSVEDDRLRCALGAGLDRAFKRADISSARAEKWVGANENHIQYW